MLFSIARKVSMAAWLAAEPERPTVITAVLLSFPMVENIWLSYCVRSGSDMFSTVA